MGRKSAPINVIVYHPTTEEGKLELSKRVASVHADYVCQTIQKLNCPTWQKEALFDAVIEDTKNRIKANKEDRSR